MSIITVALDLAKNVFHIVGINAHGKEIKKCMLQVFCSVAAVLRGDGGLCQLSSCP
ncbi:hypothetical protein [Malonomonas rubra]|uniref:hypothetical protein n=1 Tax=Malonomonas rubra TaxID=57040 RepID=UPI0026E97FC7|nr:hypothetical protein [Malonomonas rubra]